jgi:hypothetical protein
MARGRKAGCWGLAWGLPELHIKVEYNLGV